MKNRFTLLFLSLFFSFTAINVYAHEDGVWDGVKNKDGSYVTGVLTASFDPSGGVLPSPTNFAYTGTTDLTLNIPVADPNNYSDPTVALNAQDGWSTTEPWVTGFANNGSYDSPTPLIGTYDNSIPGQIDPTSVVSGQSVRMFEGNFISSHDPDDRVSRGHQHRKGADPRSGICGRAGLR